ncbi:AAA family ATPase [Shewanella oncorhynchi]|uniref:AAA family ATPase n=1 Tax=Shewanella oncorhynchi TaxID=2726434 RepID=UPI002E7BD333|nr:DUF3696 domain-containing protein [Shewanella oncorhynchi]WVI94419.1 DUF3696 domain-containing protein [Shewanella oncorhynchi]
MKLKITNFKAISTTQEFNLDNINIIAGQNSGGKSSLIHALLFLKQNLEDKQEELLKFNKPLLSLGQFNDVVSKKVNNGCLSFSFVITKLDLDKSRYSKYFRDLDFKNAEYRVSFESVRQSIGNNTYIKSIEILITTTSDETQIVSFTRKRGNSYHFQVSDNFDDFSVRGEEADLKRGFMVEMNVGNFLVNRTFFYFKTFYIKIPIVDFICDVIQTNFQRINYIGPLREAPKNYYYSEDNGSSIVGTRGEFTPQFLAKNQNKKNSYYQIDNEGNFSEKIESNIFKSTKYWVCDFFKLASDMTLDKDSNGVLYQVNFNQRNSSSKVSINNVGFGMSQILPIVVQGMALPTGSILILEQPEIHLHPSVQAKLFDFFHALQKKGVSTFVETHSDHLITRLRRRVAESEGNLENLLTLIFVEYSESELKTVYNKLQLNDLGNFTYWPEGFFDQYDNDIRAILKAQIVKKKKERAGRVKKTLTDQQSKDEEYS